jgi:hypothetical protein
VIEAVGHDRHPYGSRYARPVWAIAQRGLLLMDRSNPSRCRLYMTEAGFEALMVARHGADWRERPNAATGLARMEMIRTEWQEQWQRCQRARARTREALIDSMGPLLRQQIAASR